MSRLSLDDRLSLYEPDEDDTPVQSLKGEFSTYPDVRLSTAIHVEEVEDVLNYGKTAVCKNHKKWVSILQDEGIRHGTHSLCDEPYFCLVKFVEKWPLDQVDNLKIEDIIEVSWSSYVASVGHLTQGAIGVPQFKKSDWSYVQAYLDRRLKADKIKEKFLKEWKGDPILLDQDGTFRYDSSLCTFRCPDHGHGLLPTSLFLSVLDSVQRRYSAAVYAKMYDIILKPNFQLFENFVIAEAAVLRALNTYGNNVYKLLGSWYGLVVATVVRQANDAGCEEAFTAIREGLSESLGDITACPLFRIMAKSPTSLDEIHLALELSGLAKCFGHPIVDITAGLNVVREYACSFKPSNLDVGATIANEFKAMFCSGFYKEKGTWPPVTIKSNCSPVLRDAIQSNYWPQAHQMRHITKEDFAAIEIGRCLDFDYHPDMLDILVDKSCAPPLRHWTAAYDPCGFTYHHGQRPPRISDPPNRRVLLKFLQADEIAGYEKIARVNAGLDDPNDAFILLCPKEGELKIESRLFSILTFSSRLYIGLTGHNLAQHIMRYLKSQTMTASELENLKKAFSYATEASTDDLFSVLFFVLDFKKFNCQFRLALLLQLCRIIDSIYGFKNVFQDLHAFFSRAYVAANSRTRPPKIGRNGMPELGPRCHTDNEGGFEGVAQKLWTLAIQLLLIHFMREMGIRGSLTGQGDNQVIIARLNHEQRRNVRTFAKRVLNQLEIYANKWQIPIKKPECWYSGRLYENNKDLFYGHVQISNGMKYAIKVSSDSNDALGSFETKIANIATNCEAVGRKVSNTQLPLLLQATEVIVGCYQKGFLGKDLKSYRAMPIWHTVVGGLPVSFLIKFAFRGFPDPLTSQLSLMKYLRDNNRDLLEELIKLVPLEMSYRQSSELLLLNPHALRLEDSLSQTSSVREEVHGMIESFATNPLITRYFGVDARDKAKSLSDQLLTVRPYVAKLCSEIYRTSDAGVALSIIGTLDHTRTMVRLTQSTGSTDIVKLVRDKENNYLVKVRNHYQAPLRDSRLRVIIDDISCPTEAAKNLRIESWGFEVHGATVAMPCDQLNFVTADEATPDQASKGILVTVSNEILEGRSSVLTKTGPFKPYFGSKTVEKTYRSAKLVEVQTMTVIKAASRLGTILSWVTRTGNKDLINFVRALLLEKNIDVTELSPQVTGGSIHHRLSSVVSVDGCLVSLPLNMVHLTP